MRKLVLFFIIVFGINCVIVAQKKDSTSGFKEYYPIHIKPSIGYLSSMNDFEDILFDAKPVVYYSFWNNMRARIKNSGYRPGNAIYILFQPQIRMYTEESLPVKTPSYRAALGWQILKKRLNDDFYSIALETGHYSNGQSGCAFASGIIDETEDCENVHQTINSHSNLSELLNRANGNFSTNWTKLSANYRFNIFRDNGRPRRAYSISASWERFHNNMLYLIDIGGYSDFDISIYGKNRFNLGFEFIHTYGEKFRYSAELKAEYIDKPHKFVEPIRVEASFILYPFDLGFGIYATYIYGHDNYNYRFVDSGNQIGIGLIWDWFAPVDRMSGEILDKKNKS